MSRLDEFYEYPNSNFKGSYCFTKDSLINLVAVLKKNFPTRGTQFKFTVTLKSGLTFSSKSLDNIFIESNAGENIISRLSLEASCNEYFQDGYKSISIDINLQKDMKPVSLKAIAKDRNWVVNVATTVTESIKLLDTHFGILYNFPFIFTLAIVLGISLNASKYLFFKEPSPLVDLLFSFLSFPSVIFLGQIGLNSLFPRVVIAIGNEQRKQERRVAIKNYILGTIIISGLGMGFFFYFLPSIIDALKKL